jgi:hypothetical protein
MDAGYSDRLRTIVTTLDDWIEFLSVEGFADAARLLAIAKLEIQIRSHNISDNELRAICDVISARKARDVHAGNGTAPCRNGEPPLAGSRLIEAILELTTTNAKALTRTQ